MSEIFLGQNNFLDQYFFSTKNFLDEILVPIFFVSKTKQDLRSKVFSLVRPLVIVKPESFEKSMFLCENPKKMKIRYSLEIRCFIKKRSAKIKPRHLGCYCFLQKDRNGRTQKVNKFQYVLIRQNFQQ